MASIDGFGFEVFEFKEIPTRLKWSTGSVGFNRPISLEFHGWLADTGNDHRRQIAYADNYAGKSPISEYAAATDSNI